MKKEEVMNRLYQSAALYCENLLNYNFLLLCMDKHKKVTTIEVLFDVKNFLHLTGVRIRGEHIKGAKDFFMACLDKRLGPGDFDLSPDGTTEMKLRVLPQLFAKNLSANMVGDFAARTPVLVTEKLTGGVKGCMGFVFDKKLGYYVPNTVLNADIRAYIKKPLRVIAVYRKHKQEHIYTEQVHRAKNIDWNQLVYAENINLPLAKSQFFGKIF